MRKAEKEKVVISIPVRADIAGAFSDLAYYLDKYGIEKGEVTNICLPVEIEIVARIDEENGNMVIQMPDLNQEIEGDINELKKQESNNVSQVVTQFVNLFNLDTSGLTISIDSGRKIPPASGLGTSSAVGVGVIRALAELYGLHGINPCELNYIVELAMGIMGGKQDYYAAWLGGLNYLHFYGPNKSLVKVEEHLEEKSGQYNWLLNRCMVYFSGKSRSSGVANAEPEEKVENDPDIIRRIASVAKDSWQAIKSMDSIELKKCINLDRENRLELSRLYYENEMEEMGKSAEKLGYAHRACGAGMGGCMLFFGDDKKHKELEKELKKIGGWRVC